MIVVDTNVIGYLHVASPHSAEAQQARTKDADWHAPRLWRSEFRNVLALYQRKHRLTLDECQLAMAKALDLMADCEHEVDSNQVLQLAATSGCSAYDCEFVAVARKLGVRLVTVDKALVKKFPGVAISLTEFVDVH